MFYFINTAFGREFYFFGVLGGIGRGGGGAFPAAGLLGGGAPLFGAGAGGAVLGNGCLPGFGLLPGGGAVLACPGGGGAALRPGAGGLPCPGGGAPLGGALLRAAGFLNPWRNVWPRALELP